MKRTIRYIILVITSIIVGVNYSTSFAAIVSCSGFNSGGRSCDVCAQDRFYFGINFSTWDWFNNTTPGMPEVVFSNGASRATIETLGNLSINNGQVTSTNIVSAFSPAGKDRIVIFNPRGLRFVTTPATRDTVAARVIYEIHASIGGGTNTLTSNAWNYTDGVESVVGGVTTLATSVTTVPGTRSFFTTTPPRTRHVECQNLYVSWCGDGTLDVGNGEVCDLGALNGQPGSACSATCTPTAVAACIAGPTTGVQPVAVTATTVGLCPVGQVVGGFTSSVVGTTTNYTWSCNGSAVGGLCSASFTSVVPPVVPPPGGGGGGPTCTPGNFTRDAGGVVPAPISAATPGLCLAGEVVGNFVDTLNGVNHSYSWSCNGIGAGLACRAFYNTVSGGGGGPPPSGGSPGTPGITTIPGSNSFCGNGFVERPNAAGQYENCDTTALWCQSCNIADTNPGTTSPGNLTITTPGSSSLGISAYRLIIGDQVPVFSSSDIVAFETNTPIYLQNKTATITNRSPLLNGGTVSKTINNVGVGGVVRFEVSRTYNATTNTTGTITYEDRTYPNSTILFQGSELQGLKGDTSDITGNFEDTIVTNPTYRSQGLYASLQYLESPFHIRVSLPVIGNTAGGSAFIGSALGNSVNVVVQTFFNNLRSGNFTTSTVNASSSYALSSATRSVSDDNTLSQIIASGSERETGKITQASIGTSGVYNTTSIASNFEIDSKSTRLGDTSSVRVFKNGDVSIDGNIDLTGIKTVVIENGNLIIDKDIRYADKISSFAWIVKNGNIIIADSVRNIAGVYVTLAGAIESNGISTPNRLTVDGSLYGNTADLVNNRSYVRGQTGYSALNVGVVVNYSNRAIMYPPPFLSRFLDQYSLEKVAR